MTAAAAAMATVPVSSQHLGFRSSHFVALPGACLPLPLPLPLRLRRRQLQQRSVSLSVSVRAVHDGASSSSSQVALRKHYLCGRKTSGYTLGGATWITKTKRGGRLARAVYEDDNGLPDDAISDGPLEEPEYFSYNDPNTGEPAPTYGIRTPLPDRRFWNEDMVDITRSTQATTPFDSSRIDFSEPSEKRKMSGGRRRKNDLPPTEAQIARAKEEEAENEALLQSLKEKFSSDEEDEQTEISYVDSDDEEEEEEDEDGEEEEEDEDGEGETTSTVLDVAVESPDESTLALATIDNGEVDLTKDSKPLTNDELWWNWRKPPPDQKPWSAWQKRAGDCDTVMAAAMAETGQIELFGEKPTIAEATLARARKRVFYAERMEAEEARKKEIGAMAYYKEWVKNYNEETSKEAVQRRFEETGEEEGVQLLDMFQHQTREEYRVMQGTDIRIRRDPLTMRMREDQIKQEDAVILRLPTPNDMHYAFSTVCFTLGGQCRVDPCDYTRVSALLSLSIYSSSKRMKLLDDILLQSCESVWGGDPVYPTVNYEQDPDSIADYRNPNMHEPIPDIVEMLRESGRLITQEEVKRLQDLEKAQELEFAEDDMLSGAVDIGDDEEGNDEEDDDEDGEDELPEVPVVATKSSQPKSSEPIEAAFRLDEEDVPKVELLEDEDEESE
ncbi:hypothetical protein AXG93_3911s1270 [Marchantia polymorpha subsp. ruderalis]|uniref:Uncharacterized protein n=1 Tax=Marchantia polymorpha subsp. ruderalis TaxID=1480154 RepID=A0A176W4Q3_MARPO|nr:hypothetical protein AXG93_3911s1270 [Marchantia polymorpha subsp. ruderalis]